jgi:hypothetical protein
MPAHSTTRYNERERRESAPPCGDGLGLGVRVGVEVGKYAAGNNGSYPPAHPSPTRTPQGGRDQAEFAARIRDQFIPVRKADLLDALIEHGSLATQVEREKFREVCRILAAIYHYETYAELERLRQDYFYFDPELDPHARFDDGALEAAYADLVASFIAVLSEANFVEIPRAEIERAHRERKTNRVAVTAALDDFREVRFFRRGHHHDTVAINKWFGLRQEMHEVVVYDDVVLFVATKPANEIAARRERKLLARRRIRPGSVLIKYFRNIAASDLNALFPNVRVVMSVFGALLLGVTALAGAIPILLNLASTFTVLFLVIGFYLGVVAAVEHDELKTAFAAMSGLAALIGFVMRQWLRYQRQSLKYQQELTDNIYFRNVNNNAGIFDYMIGAAEDQECKEGFLAYYFLCTGRTPASEAELENAIECWLKERFGVNIDFKIGDTVGKLERLGLLSRDGGRLSVPEPEQTLARLEATWRSLLSRRSI